MATYLLTWNPNRWYWKNIDQMIEYLHEHGSVSDRWSCGRSKKLQPGDRVFLLKQGEEPRGLIASGWITTRPFVADHWEDTSSQLPRPALYVNVDWDVLARDPIIPRGELAAPRFASVHWNTQSSGISIDAAVTVELERVWGDRTGSHFGPGPDEVIEPDYHEGAIHRVAVNAYERNALARAACIKHYGYRCFICSFNFEERYGSAGAGLIHVHHLQLISDIGRDYVVDPITDLRPVCPNCHALIHRRYPPYELADVASMLRP